MSGEEQQLEKLLRDRGLGWAVDMFAPSSHAARHYLESLTGVEQYLRERQRGTTEFSPATLERLAAISPYKADAFLQALVSIHGLPMLCAAWRVLQGMEVESVELHYTRLSEFSIRVVLRSPYGETEEYESGDIHDVAFLRHLGKSLIEGKPLFDGFYALRQR